MNNENKLSLSELATENISVEWRDLLCTKDLNDILSVVIKDNFTPKLEHIFNFARLTDLSNIKVVIIGQDPYPKAGDAHGLAFSCLTGVPATLKNIFKCLLKHKLINEIPISGNLEYWAKQGVLLLNRSLSTAIGKPNEHSALWDTYIIRLVKKISKMKPLIFMLWGNNAKSLKSYIDNKCVIMEWGHPSPLAQAYQSFIDCPHFVDTNKKLKQLELEPIDWNLEPCVSDVEKYFKMHNMKHVVFTDGSCYPNKKCSASRGGYAAAFVLGPLKDTIIYGSLHINKNYASNQRAEGTAILRTLQYLETIDNWTEVTIVSDSMFWINMLEKYMPKWEKKNEDFNNKKNPDITISLWDIYKRLISDNKLINLIHIKSHNKNGWDSFPEDSYEYFCFAYNDYVDRLAEYGREELKPGEYIITTAEDENNKIADD